VRDGFLVHYDAVAVRSDVRMHGIVLNESEQGRTRQPQDRQTATGLLEAERQFDTADIEARVTAPDSNRKILEEVRSTH
jgi:type I restriction enzyme, R subunit